MEGGAVGRDAGAAVEEGRPKWRRGCREGGEVEGPARWRSSCDALRWISGDDSGEVGHELGARRGELFDGNGTRRGRGFL